MWQTSGYVAIYMKNVEKLCLNNMKDAEAPSQRGWMFWMTINVFSVHPL